MNYTDLGLRDMGAGLREAKILLRRRQSELRARVAADEAEIVALAKIESAVAASLEVLLQEQEKRAAAAEEK